MKKLLLAAAIVGMTGFAFGQQQTASKDSKDSKSCAKTCTKSCTDKSCKKGTCTHDGKKCTTSTASAASTATKK